MIALPAHAQQNAASEADADETLECVDTGEGGNLAIARCMVEHRLALVKAQDILLKRIGDILAGSGPQGTDYKAAAVSLGKAQESWSVFVDSDCAIVGDVFGYGTAQGLAGESCVIDHYTIRNDQLQELEDSYLKQ